MQTLLLAAFAALFLAACVMMAPAPVKVEGGVYTNSAGMTLYTYDKDVAASGKSVCNGPCATAWPPLMASAADASRGDWTIVTRDDGSRQWAYKGLPVYLWVKDRNPGDRTGDRFNNVWSLVRP